MLVSEMVQVTISNNGKYYSQKGYGDLKQRDKIMVELTDLPVNSNIKVLCNCDICFGKFERQFQLLNRTVKHLCKNCSYLEKFETRDYTKIKDSASKRSGNLHARFNPNKTAYHKYRSEVLSLTRKNNLSMLENFERPRGICGKEGAYQLDHIVSIKHGFDSKIPVETIAHISNLRFVPWEVNRSKSFHYKY